VSSNTPAPNLSTLIGLFYPEAGEFGQVEKVHPADMPDVYQKLLAHEHHMTVTVESHYGELVDVQVLESMHVANYYSRKILLTKQSDRSVVQFGIVRLNFDYLAGEVQQEIVGEGTPLGRILIDRDVLRRVELSELWKISVGQDLAELFNVASGTGVWGRTGWIHCNGEPAIELLEVVSPTE
jgi:chorismate-pyruvate lyase